MHFARIALGMSLYVVLFSALPIKRVGDEELKVALVVEFRDILLL